MCNLKINDNQQKEISATVFRGETGHPNKHGAVFFTPDRSYAETGNFGYEKRTVIQANITMKNPVVVNSLCDTSFEVLEKNIKKWKRQGYDGLVGKLGDYIFEYAVFSKEQILLIN